MAVEPHHPLLMLLRSIATETAMSSGLAVKQTTGLRLDPTSSGSMAHTRTIAVLNTAGLKKAAGQANTGSTVIAIVIATDLIIPATETMMTDGMINRDTDTTTNDAVMSAAVMMIDIAIAIVIVIVTVSGTETETEIEIVTATATATGRGTETERGTERETGTETGTGAETEIGSAIVIIVESVNVNVSVSESMIQGPKMSGEPKHYAGWMSSAGSATIRMKEMLIMTP